MKNIALCMRTFCEVRNFACQKFRLTPATFKLLWCEVWAEWKCFGHRPLVQRGAAAFGTGLFHLGMRGYAHYIVDSVATSDVLREISDV